MLPTYDGTERKSRTTASEALRPYAVYMHGSHAHPTGHRVLPPSTYPLQNLRFSYHMVRAKIATPSRRRYRKARVLPHHNLSRRYTQHAVSTTYTPQEPCRDTWTCVQQRLLTLHRPCLHSALLQPGHAFQSPTEVRHIGRKKKGSGIVSASGES